MGRNNAPRRQHPPPRAPALRPRAGRCVDAGWMTRSVPVVSESNGHSAGRRRPRHAIPCQHDTPATASGVSSCRPTAAPGPRGNLVVRQSEVREDADDHAPTMDRGDELHPPFAATALQPVDAPYAAQQRRSIDARRRARRRWRRGVRTRRWNCGTGARSRSPTSWWRPSRRPTRSTRASRSTAYVSLRDRSGDNGRRGKKSAKGAPKDPSKPVA
jgi:hypothetical protein